MYSILNLDEDGTIIAEQILQRIHPDDTARIQSSLAKELKNKKVLSLDFRITTKKGKVKHIQLQRSKINNTPEEEVLFRLGTVQDVTKLKQSEIVLEQTLKKEQELNLLKSRFVSMASHEFRTPLSSILSSTGLINIHGDRVDFDKQKRHIARIKYSVSNLTYILNDFLSIEKIESGQVHFAT